MLSVINLVWLILSIFICILPSDASAQDSDRKTLVIHAVHGLSNRLRAIASAYDLAVKSNRVLVIIWEKDVHVGCDFDHLFKLKGNNITVKLLSSYQPHEFRDDAYDFYDYMTTDKGKAIDYESSRDIFVKSAYRLNSALWSVPDENMRLKLFQPSAEAKRLINRVLSRLPQRFTGVHVRNLAPLEEIANLPLGEYKPGDLALLDRYRRYSNATAFLSKMKFLEEHEVDAFYVAADNQQLIKDLASNLRSQVVWIDNLSCGDRSCQCLTFAIADLWILSLSEAILGSYWSSYSEVAGALGGIPVDYVSSDEAIP